MGKNPMQSAGCYAICAAILRNPGSILHDVDFSVSHFDIQDDCVCKYSKMKLNL